MFDGAVLYKVWLGSSWGVGNPRIVSEFSLSSSSLPKGLVPPWSFITFLPIGGDRRLEFFFFRVFLWLFWINCPKNKAFWLYYGFLLFKWGVFRKKWLFPLSDLVFLTSGSGLATTRSRGLSIIWNSFFLKILGAWGKFPRKFISEPPFLRQKSSKFKKTIKKQKFMPPVPSTL